MWLLIRKAQYNIERREPSRPPEDRGSGPGLNFRRGRQIHLLNEMRGAGEFVDDK